MQSIASNSTSYQPSSILSKKIRNYNENLDKLLPYLKSAADVLEVNSSTNYDTAFAEICKSVEPTIIHLRTGSEHAVSTSYTIRNALIEEQDFIELKTFDFVRDESERKTELGQEFLLYNSACKNITPDMYVKMLRRIIYSGHLNRNKFLLSQFPDNNERAIEFDNNCAKITAIIYTTNEGPVVDIKQNNLNTLNIDSMFQK